MRTLDVAGAVGRFLAKPPARATGASAQGGSRLIADILEALDQERLGGMVKTAVAARIRSVEVAPLLGQTLEAAITERAARADARRDRHLGRPDARRQ